MIKVAFLILCQFSDDLGFFVVILINTKILNRMTEKYMYDPEGVAPSVQTAKILTAEILAAL